jgi:guanylate kinase
MDWSRCLAIGLQNQGVIFRVYGFYTEANKKRNDYITKHLDETLGADETGLLFMREGHQIQFPADVQVFYVSPPSLDEIHRWFRDRESQPEEQITPEKEGQEQS